MDQNQKLTNATLIIQVLGYPPGEMSPARCMCSSTKGTGKKKREDKMSKWKALYHE